MLRGEMHPYGPVQLPLLELFSLSHHCVCVYVIGR